jgi:hypothetical protein
MASAQVRECAGAQVAGVCTALFAANRGKPIELRGPASRYQRREEEIVTSCSELKLGPCPQPLRTHRRRNQLIYLLHDS